MIDSVDSTIDHTQNGLVRKLNRTSRLLLRSFNEKKNTASILKSTRVRTISFKRSYHCACPINYPSGYSGKHINSPYGVTIL